jgi:kynurenine formamidase
MSDAVPTPTLPTPTTPYRELPVSDGVRHCWGAWGADDVLGCLNRLDAAAALRGRECMTRGVAFSLNWDMKLPEPALFRRPSMRHETVVSANGSSLNDVISDWNTQASSQWDGFRHVTWGGHGQYGGHSRHSMHYWAERGIVGRCVLADVARWRATRGRPIDYTRPDPVTAADLRATLDSAGVQVEPGDILLIRVGWIEWYGTADAATRAAMTTHEALVSPGLSAQEDVAELLWDWQLAAVAADNPALEPWPQRAEAGPDATPDAAGKWPVHLPVTLHWRLLPALGLPIGELWDLDALAADSAAHGRYDGLLTSAPLHLTGGAASSANALVLR